MKIVCAPDSFKESMTAQEAARCLAQGIRRALPDAQCIEIPLADGGEGFTEALSGALGARPQTVSVQGPLGDAVKATIGLSAHRAIVEVAQAVGLSLVPPDRRSIRDATSYGVGQLIQAALKAGVSEILVGLGGSATNDGGAGMLRALGVRFLDAQGLQLDGSPRSLSKLTQIDASGIDARLKQVKIRVACDVNNPLLGRKGASAVFGPQKGATESDVRFLDESLTKLAEVGGQATGTAHLAGAGAAGGLGYAFLTYLPSQLESGIEIVLDVTEFRQQLRGADYVFTGEGTMDRQTLMGKALSGVARYANEEGVPLIGFAGKIAEDAHELYNHGFVALIPIVQNVSTLAQALQEGQRNLTDAAERTVRLLRQSLL